MKPNDAWPNDVAFHPAALGELLEAIDWYSARERHLGERFLQAVRRAIATIVASPGLGRASDLRTRALGTVGFPSLVIYRATADGIQVISDSHTSRRPDHWFGRN